MDMQARIPTYTQGDSDNGVCAVLNEKSKEIIHGFINDLSIATEEYVKYAQGALQFDIDQSTTIPHSKVRAQLLLRTMLDCAPMCGGDRGTRYAACAIVSTRRDVNTLIGLASDWLKFLLWPFKIAYRAKTDPDDESNWLHYSNDSEDTIESAATDCPSFTEKLEAREDLKCAILVNICHRRLCSPAHPERGRGILEGTHIVRAPIIHCPDTDHPLKRRPFDATLEILQCYADIPEAMMAQLDQLTDAPENGILMDSNMHTSFDAFWFCLMETDVPHRYDVKWLSEPHWVIEFRGPKGPIDFTDHSHRGIPLPNPKLIAIHAAIAHVLEFSGAGEYIDNILDASELDEFANSSGGPEASDPMDFDLEGSLMAFAEMNLHVLPVGGPAALVN
ncbi:hypothetical protein BOTBODRAFT_54884 [Botryobasidium botryosum FD-172 SS1]|uniref:HNH nuclease domain-containing protein n=1 Tax=Botryobasidium botryosum (strain FD-172 SS1) TaxID=930990 RepID=A0A067MHW7_BOTB1|nr:hypothetical protein BOTBODRAFT_54884 [Botryobasidium botryosum FD-172 SS1]